jgi:predicted DCC family thiol-disulfide oxidoreductase YuxK
VSSRLPVGYRFYWDDHCKLCNVCKRIGEALDWSKRITFLPLLSDPADIDLGHLTFEERMASSHLVAPDNRVYSRGAGALKAASLLPLLAPLAFLFRLIPKHEVIVEKIYDFVSSHRGVPYGGSCKVDFGEGED